MKKMKKLLLCVLLIASAMTYTNAQPAAPAPTDAAKWSFALKGGVDYFRVTPMSTKSDNQFINDASWGLGASIERTVNPLIGYGINFDWLNFNRNTVIGKTLDPTLFTSINLTNLFYPKRQSGKFNVYSNFGVGASFSNYDLAGSMKGYEGNTGDQIGAVGTAGLAMEYNISRLIGIGLEGQYRSYSKENLAGLESKDRNDDALTLMATLRFKLGTGTKDHVRGMTMSDYYPAPAPVIMKEENPYDDSAITSRLDGIDKTNQDIQNRLKDLEDAVKDLKNKPVGTGVNASFQNIEFEFDSSKLTEASYSTLDQIANILKSNPTWGTLVVKGNTDSTGPEGYNQTLSEARANSVKKYLASKGVSESVMSSVGFGESKPIADNATAAGRQANRRVEFEITK